VDLHLEVFVPKKKEIVVATTRRWVDLHLEVFVPKKKEIIVAITRGWGITEYLQLDWMDGWKKLHDHDVLYYMFY
jgi:hypothetical protein